MQMSVTVPFTTEEAQTAYQTVYTTAIQTLNVASMYWSSNTNVVMLAQDTYSMTAPNSGASVLAVMSGASLAFLAAVF